MTAPPPSARWRPPNGRRSLSHYFWMAWLRIVLAAFVVAQQIVALVHGGNIPVAVLLLFAFAFIGSNGIWMLQGIHWIRRDLARREMDESRQQPGPSEP